MLFDEDDDDGDDRFDDEFADEDNKEVDDDGNDRGEDDGVVDDDDDDVDECSAPGVTSRPSNILCPFTISLALCRSSGVMMVSIPTTQAAE